jgi:NADPH:quinone reductase-like Zn-dependent oxidoreductase
MRRRYKVLAGIVVFLAAAAGAFAGYLAHEGECRPPVPLAAGAQRMRAIVYRCYGGPERLQLEDIARPALADERVLVKVHAAAVNPVDFHYLRGEPYVMRLSAGVGAPDNPRLGVDFAGTVEAVGARVQRFKVGDEVFGGVTGAFAEYVSLTETRALALKPANISFEQAAGVGVAGVTALQALRDIGGLRPGQRVLINGASGGVGTFAVQIAVAMGAEVTGVCSTRNVAMVRGLGAGRVFDYTREDFTQSSERYDLIVDTVGNHPLSALRGVLTPQGTVAVVGGPNDGKWIGPLTVAVKAAAYSPFVSQAFRFFIAELNQKDLDVLRGLMQDGKVTPVIDRRYPLAEVPEAIRYLEEGHARGKVIINVAE